ncbi:MAG: trehalase family glycosidase [Verrucomicrobiota bacterium]
MKTAVLNVGMVVAAVLSGCGTKMPDDVKEVRAFISENLPKTVRFQTEDEGIYFGLPRPYSVPAIKGMFQEMYYWDTFFMNKGLIADGQLEQAKNNTENILYLIDRFGFMPNGSHRLFLSRSQPPYASMMVRAVYEQTGDKEWLAKACKTLETEYNGFWMADRLAPNGLNRYGNQADDKELLEFYEYLFSRFPNFDTTGIETDKDKRKVGSHFIAEAESGWDFTPRFDSRCGDFNPIDLNCNLYMYEKNFEFYYSELGWEGSEKWVGLAKKRKALINQYCCNPKDGLFYDHDFVNNKLSPVFSSANFNVLWSGVATPEQAANVWKNLPRLELDHGVTACEPAEQKQVYQWDAPNGWANLQYLAIFGLEKFGYKEDAKRIADKYTDIVVKNFKATGNIWEKYNVAEGTINVNNEYEMPPLMGWSASVFIITSEYKK